MLEVYYQNRWIVVDIDSGKLFMKDKSYLNFIQLVDAVPSDDYEIISLNQGPNLDLSGFIEDGFNYSMISETLYADESQLRKWYKRVLQVPLIETNNGYAFFSPESSRKRIEQYNGMFYMDRDEWMKTFYGEGKL